MQLLQIEEEINFILGDPEKVMDKNHPSAAPPSTREHTEKSSSDPRDTKMTQSYWEDLTRMIYWFPV